VGPVRRGPQFRPAGNPTASPEVDATPRITASLASRRSLLVGAGFVAATALGGMQLHRSRHVHVPLFSETVAVDGTGHRSLVAATDADKLLPRSRVVQGVNSATALTRENAWLDTLSGLGKCEELGSLLRAAAQDLYVLSAGLPAAVAGWSPKWRYVWPRDTAHVAVAFDALGRRDLAQAQLDYLATVQRPDGAFEARYDPWSGAKPDSRSVQLDGCGWYLWGVARVGRTDSSWLLEHRNSVTRTLRRIIAALDAKGRPPAVPDYWEVEPGAPTLGTAAVLLAGLEKGVELARIYADSSLERDCRSAHAALARCVIRDFADHGYPREIGGAEPDAAVTFLSPFYQSALQPPGYVDALRTYEKRARRPAGGVAPGAGWKNDGISWTPQVALLAGAYASIGQAAEAARLCVWLGNHRTRAGSFPEKVLHDGKPAAVAPLAWTAALVISTLTMNRNPPVCESALS